MKTFRILNLAILAALALAACSQNTTGPVAPLPTTSPSDRQTRVLDAIATAVSERYIYDAASQGWETGLADSKKKVADGLTTDEFEEAVRGLVGSLPDGSASYQTRGQRLELGMQNTAEYSGIGAFISVRAEPEPHIVILSVIKDSPAEKAGLKAHDSIYSIDGQAVTREEGPDVVKRVRGETGVTVTLEVQSPSEARRTIRVVRDKITASDSIKGGVLPSLNILYTLMPVSTDGTEAQVIAQVMNQNPDLVGVIIDLRVSLSSGSWPLDGMLALYADGELGEFYTREENTSVTAQGVDAGGSQKVPLVVIVGPDTQGPPEVFAAALQAAGRATVIGMQTPGQIYGYTTLNLPDGSVLTLATSSYKTSKGLDLSESGVKPDVILDSDWDKVSVENDPALDRALELLLK
jgi:carboxyl-terminal processing protease